MPSGLAGGKPPKSSYYIPHKVCILTSTRLPSHFVHGTKLPVFSFEFPGTRHPPTATAIPLTKKNHARLLTPPQGYQGSANDHWSGAEGGEGGCGNLAPGERWKRTGVA